ncbi:hypothetical protein TVAG_075440 [Trichomonas vaginalis G3]|uniref:RasGEF domain containing protein n=1 Tax=Trichomonas vaginalis (strain ATCC PRA-98 / G3) TaxID=412133 RepID=A2FEF1_TRIV3|nr:guanyl-nucleotide exchange factor protein [Trichomonas vaginalis G3]EAX96738.1 hypothetical protein TVAG_075440 [Trichomonas vaginalis G3]KAI5521742.1 guanyl-nucleotide exchange factor protein [Trichomonas vaginalis G3]|eukprot:XP_001309668.1 hypothetical protein [Trichomonas vaginalis G3]
MSTSESKTSDKPVDPEADKSQWLNEIFEREPELSVLREKLLPLTGGISFANVVFTDTIQDTSVANRYEVLNLISQHLKLLGLYHTADVLANESGYKFLNPPNDDWETSDLRMILSLSLGLRDNPWDVPPEPNHHYVPEEHEEDYNASPYREDPTKIWEEYMDPNINSVYGDKLSYSSLKASSLRRIVVMMVHPIREKTLTDDDIHNIFLSLHSITSSEHFFELLMHLFYLRGHPTILDDLSTFEIQPLRVNIINLIKKWLTFHGLFIGKKTLKLIQEFLKTISEDTAQFQYINKVTVSLLASMPTLTYGRKSGSLTQEKERPLIPDPLIILSSDLKLFDPDSKEVARQITLLSYDVFASIHSLEFFNAFSPKHQRFSTPTLNEFSLFHERLQLLVMETIAYSPDPASTYKKAMMVFENLKEMCNFQATAAFAQVLGRTDIQKLCGIDDKDQKKPEDLFSGGEDYDNRLKEAYSVYKSAIPNMDVEIKNGKVSEDEMPVFLGGLINWERIRKLSSKVAIIYRLQNTKVNFYPVSQIQKVITRGAIHDEREIELHINLRSDVILEKK